MKKLLIMGSFVLPLGVSGMIFPLTKEPYDHNVHLWTSESSVAAGHPQAVIIGTPVYGPFQGTPIAPQYLITAQHLSGSLTEVEFKGQRYGIESIISGAGDELALIKIRDGTFPNYAKIASHPPVKGDLITCYGYGWSAGAALKDKRGKITGWQNAKANKAQRVGVLKVAKVEPAVHCIEWNWGEPSLGTSSCLFTAGDSGGGMFDNLTGYLASVIHRGTGGGFYRNQTNGECQFGYLFNGSEMYNCFVSSAATIPLCRESYFSASDRVWIKSIISPPIKINAGGPTVGEWQGWYGGYSSTLNYPVDTGAITNGSPAPAEVYKSTYRIRSGVSGGWGVPAITFTASNLLRTEEYKVRLHFGWTPITIRQEIKINGETIESNFDPNEAGQSKPRVWEVAAVRPGKGNNIVLEIKPTPGSGGEASISGIEITLNQ